MDWIREKMYWIREKMYWIMKIGFFVHPYLRGTP